MLEGSEGNNPLRHTHSEEFITIVIFGIQC
jgi:hypothetical protein